MKLPDVIRARADTITGDACDRGQRQQGLLELFPEFLQLRTKVGNFVAQLVSEVLERGKSVGSWSHRWRRFRRNVLDTHDFTRQGCA